MKRKIRQIQHTIDGTYAVADDGTWWRVIDPLATNWVQLPGLPDSPDPSTREAFDQLRAEESRSSTRFKVKP